LSVGTLFAPASYAQTTRGPDTITIYIPQGRGIAFVNSESDGMRYAKRGRRRITYRQPPKGPRLPPFSPRHAGSCFFQPSWVSRPPVIAIFPPLTLARCGIPFNPPRRRLSELCRPLKCYRSLSEFNGTGRQGWERPPGLGDRRKNCNRLYGKQLRSSSAFMRPNARARLWKLPSCSFFP
jgi:hypothetical protein